MFEALPQAKQDSILSLINEFKLDKRLQKIDLSVGVYRDENGNTPIMSAVLAAESKFIHEQHTKTYVGLNGDKVFNERIANLILGNTVNSNCLAKSQAVGGSGALRLLGELIVLVNDKATIWLSEPTWPNHCALFNATGLKCDFYPYFDQKSQSVQFERLYDFINTISANDIIVLHGCCHNPTGCDLSLEQWQSVGELLQKRKIIPLIDLAYQGLGQGLKKDVEGVRKLVEKVPVAMISSSSSKNFGLYRDRVGCALVKCTNSNQAKKLDGHLGVIGRKLYSMPPHHGAGIVKTILTSETLFSQWKSELNTMRERISSNRKLLESALTQILPSQNWEFLTQQQGMFSLLGLNNRQLKSLKDKYGIYAVSGGRVNFAGMQNHQATVIANALLKTIKQ